MSALVFDRAARHFALGVIAQAAGSTVPDGQDAAKPIEALVPLDRAGQAHVSVHLDDMPIGDMSVTRAGACIVSAQLHDALPRTTVALVVADPAGAARRVAALLRSGDPSRGGQETLIHRSAIVHPDAYCENGVVIEAGAVINAGVEIGSGTRVAALVTIGEGVRIGRDCVIEAQVSLSHALLGDRVRIDPGCRIGCAGAPRSGPVPQGPSIGRVIIQNDVVIGANAVVERGWLDDTIVGDLSWLAATSVVAGGSVLDRLSHRG